MIEQTLIYISCGLIAGTFGGLLGLGGGVILIPILHFIFGLSIAESSGISIFAVIFTTIGGSIEYYKLKLINFKFLLPIIIFGAVSSSTFSFLFSYLSNQQDALKLIIGMTLIITSVAMIREALRMSQDDNSKALENFEYKGPLAKKCLIGIAGGILPGLLGLGGGVIMVPALNLGLKLPIKIAIASSLFTYMLNAIISTGIKFTQGFIDLKIAIPIAAGTFIGSFTGAYASKYIPSRNLRVLFGVVVGYIAIKFILQTI